MQQAIIDKLHPNDKGAIALWAIGGISPKKSDLSSPRAIFGSSEEQTGSFTLKLTCLSDEAKGLKQTFIDGFNAIGIDVETAIKEEEPYTVEESIRYAGSPYSDPEYKTFKNKVCRSTLTITVPANIDDVLAKVSLSTHQSLVVPQMIQARSDRESQSNTKKLIDGMMRDAADKICQLEAERINEEVKSGGLLAWIDEPFRAGASANVVALGLLRDSFFEGLERFDRSQFEEKLMARYGKEVADIQDKLADKIKDLEPLGGEYRDLKRKVVSAIDKRFGDYEIDTGPLFYRNLTEGEFGAFCREKEAELENNFKAICEKIDRNVNGRAA